MTVKLVIRRGSSIDSLIPNSDESILRQSRFNVKINPLNEISFSFNLVRVNTKVRVTKLDLPSGISPLFPIA